MTCCREVMRDGQFVSEDQTPGNEDAFMSWLQACFYSHSTIVLIYSKFKLPWVYA